MWKEFLHTETEDLVTSTLESEVIVKKDNILFEEVLGLLFIVSLDTLILNILQVESCEAPGQGFSLQKSIFR